MTKASIDSSKCTGHGMCYMTAPDVFADDDQGYGYVTIEGDLPENLIEAARHGAANCPERAITIE